MYKPTLAAIGLILSLSGSVATAFSSTNFVTPAEVQRSIANSSTREAGFELVKKLLVSDLNYDQALALLIDHSATAAPLEIDDAISGLYTHLGVENWEELREKHPDIFFPIFRYMDDPVNDGPVMWQVVNRKLRGKKQLSQYEQTFKEDLEEALRNLPSYNGVVFRGSKVNSLKKALATFAPGESFVDPAFLSTSLNPSVAQKFSSASKSEVSVLWVISSKSGHPVMIFHPHVGPESEVLFSTGVNLRTQKIILHEDQKSLIVVLEEI